ncbi:transposase [Streptomyces bobili]|uniref:transposase n=1 Tax=Streptomyces bobili TaxID=67280 RepID=UPI003F4CFF41
MDRNDAPAATVRQAGRQRTHGSRHRRSLTRHPHLYRTSAAAHAADAVALYQSRPGATIRQVAAELGLHPETARNWVRAAGASRPRVWRPGSSASRGRRPGAPCPAGPGRWRRGR